ncbi:MAG: chemotaxis protein CheC [Elusimicrobia bacterium]|nr:chemotaxis protein CheC [Elusimicrobiota bacterium]
MVFNIKDTNKINSLFAKCVTECSILLSKWLKMDVDFSLSDLKHLPFDKLITMIGNMEQITALIFSRITGKFNTTQLFLYSKENAETLVNISLSRPVDTQVAWNELERSVLEETSNIISSTMVNVFSRELDIEIIHETPVFGIDMLGSMVEQVLSDHVQLTDDVLFIKAVFNVKDKNNLLGKPVDIYFLILPGEECYNALKNKVEGKK